MLSVRLPPDLENLLNGFCTSRQLSKSQVVATALRRHLALEQEASEDDPLLALIGSGNGRYGTEEVMRLTRGEDWNQP